MEDRVVTFSVKPDDVQGLENVKQLKQQAKDTGVTFSYLILSVLNKHKEKS